MMFFVYILECADGTYYTGCTNDVEKRVHQHNTAKAGARYTKMRRPVFLRHVETFISLSEARAREAAIKKLRREEKKLLLT